MPDDSGSRVAPLWVATAVITLVAVAVMVWTASDGYRLHDPVRALQQLDMLFLQDPAPLPELVDMVEGTPTLLIVCRTCAAPPLEGLEAHVVVSDSEQVAAAYGLLSVDGRLGPGYAIIDSGGTLRYRTFDHRLTEHAQEIRILLEATP